MWLGTCFQMHGCTSIWNRQCIGWAILVRWQYTRSTYRPHIKDISWAASKSGGKHQLGFCWTNDFRKISNTCPSTDTSITCVILVYQNRRPIPLKYQCIYHNYSRVIHSKSTALLFSLPIPHASGDNSWILEASMRGGNKLILDVSHPSKVVGKNIGYETLANACSRTSSTYDKITCNRFLHKPHSQILWGGKWGKTRTTS